jgi:UDP-glucose 4-epimerase
MRGEPLMVHGDGRQSRDFTYVGTVCATIVDAIERGVSYDGPVNLAFGTRVPLVDVIQLLEAEFGRSLDREHVEPRAGDIRHSKADPALLRSLFGSIEPVDIATGIKDTVGWFQDGPAAG